MQEPHLLMKALDSTLTGTRRSPLLWLMITRTTSPKEWKRSPKRDLFTALVQVMFRHLRCLQTMRMQMRLMVPYMNGDLSITANKMMRSACTMIKGRVTKKTSMKMMIMMMRLAAEKQTRAWKA
jgi:hypothetical protein